MDDTTQENNPAATIAPNPAPAENDEDFAPAQTDVKPINIEDEMKQSMLDYSMSVIIGRALPDARDGMKPVHRRCIYAMGETGNTFEKPHKKSARVVGEVMGKYHPHGDSSIYDTIVRMAQPFSMRYMLVDGHGNFGSVDGDGAAAMRYTEVRMQRYAQDMLDDIDMETVDMVSNYDETLLEPTVLPSKLPNLLLNGSMGIAVGMSTNIPPHNLNELCDAICAMVDNPAITITELMDYVKGPDFPTYGKICGLSGIRKIYTEGRGPLCVRGHVEIVEEKGKSPSLLITDIPYGVNKAEMCAKIGELIREKKIEGIAENGVRDVSKADVRIEIDLKRDANPTVVINMLYKLTPLQSSFGAIMLALDKGRPKVMNLKQLLRCFINHRIEVITRRTTYQLRKAEERKHLLEGFRIATDNIDEIVHIIRSSQNDAEAKARMLERFNLDDIQSSAILEMRLRQLTGLQRQKIEDEYTQVLANIERYQFILANPQEILNLIKLDCEEMKKKYGDARRTEIEPTEADIDMESIIANEPCVVTLSERGYVKRCPLSEFKDQGRGGKGIIGAKTKDADAVSRIYTPMTHDRLLFFTDRGRVFTKKAWELPEGTRTSTGIPIQNLLILQPDEFTEEVNEKGQKETKLLRTAERVIRIIVTPDFKNGSDEEIKQACAGKAVFFATRKGIVKKTLLEKFVNINKTGIRAFQLRDDDKLVGVSLIEENQELMLVAESGRIIRFSEKQVRAMGRDAVGVRGMRLAGVSFDASADDAEENDPIEPATATDDDADETAGDSFADGAPDAICALVPVNAAPNARLLLLSKLGKGFLTNPDEFPFRKRGGQGVLSLRISDATGRLAFAAMTHLAEDGSPDEKPESVLILTENGTVMRTRINSIRNCHRRSSGVKIINLVAGDAVKDAEIVPAQETDEQAIESTEPIVEQSPAPEATPPTTESPAPEA